MSTSTSTLRDPSKLSFQADCTRRAILGAYWLVVFLSLPLWWHTTSIERLSLPSARVFSRADTELRFAVHVELDESYFGEDAVSLSDELQIHLRTQSEQNPQRWQGIDVHVHGKLETGDSSRAGTYAITGTKGEADVQGRQLSIPGEAGHSMPHLADLLTSLLVPYSTSPHQEHRVAQYAPRYRLAFTLLNEDSAAGQAVINWDIHGALARHISPILDSVSILHNFSIESQVQFHAPLAFKPQTVSDHTYGLTAEDLTVFVNSAKWTLSSSVSNDPVLHFVLFIPSAARRPLCILDVEGNPSASNAFLLPQWGGIVIFNPLSNAASQLQLTTNELDPIFTAFSHQLLSLLGVPRLPTEVRLNRPLSSLTGWQFDALVRRRALENARVSQNTLKSIVKLVDQIENMPVGQYVKGDVLDALTALDKLYSVATTSPTLALRYSSEALALGSRAFFNPAMLALLYFPVEHKYAVYAPLFASAMIPLLGAALREGFAWRRSRRGRAREKNE